MQERMAVDDNPYSIVEDNKMQNEDNPFSIVEQEYYMSQVH